MDGISQNKLVGQGGESGVFGSDGKAVADRGVPNPESIPFCAGFGIVINSAGELDTGVKGC